MNPLEELALWPLVVARAAATPDAVLAVDERDRTLTFAGLRDQAEHAARSLQALGVRAGTIVSWQLPTRIESLVAVCALARLGAVQNPLLPIYRERELTFISHQIRPAFHLSPGTWRGYDYDDLARRTFPVDTRIVTCSPDRPACADDSTPAALAPWPRPSGDGSGDDAVRWVFYTSGTTADPKGARHTDRSVATPAVGFSRAVALTPGDRLPLVFPFTHVGGINILIALLMSGAGAILVEHFDPAATPGRLADLGVTIGGSGTPFILLYLELQRRRPDVPLFPRLRVALAGASPKPPQLHEEVKRELGGVGVISGYGLTEAPMVTFCSVEATDEHKATTEGPASAGAELRIVAEGNDCRPGEVGEVWARGPHLCRGYVDASLDAAAFTPDGWFRSGDLGFLDDEGYLTITGRIKDIIIRNGENISAKEIEDVLYGHRAVADVAVIGVPDRRAGERCCAVVVTAPGQDPLTMGTLTEWCRSQGLMTQKIPERLELIDELPRNASGKVQKHHLREHYVDGTALPQG